MNGEYIANKNVSANIKKSKFYVCPICENIIHSVRENIVSCCSMVLHVLEAENEDDNHKINIEKIENEYLVSLNHEVTKQHNISFIAYVTVDRCEILELYPEQEAMTRILRRDSRTIYVYCNKDGLIKKNI